VLSSDMTLSEQRVPDPGKEIFHCRPVPLLNFFAMRYQGALPSVRLLRVLGSAIVLIAETIIFAGLPTVLLLLVFSFVLGPKEPSWARNLCFAVLTVSCPFAVWWFWGAPRGDKLVIDEREFRWRISLVCWEWFRARGSVPVSELESFSYRSDCFDIKPSEYGKTTAEKLNKILLELDMSRYSIRFHLRNGKEITIEKFFARFEPADLHRFLAHLTNIAQRHEIVVASTQPGPEMAV
jgi:hypothetical protein